VETVKFVEYIDFLSPQGAEAPGERIEAIRRFPRAEPS